MLINIQVDDHKLIPTKKHYTDAGYDLKTDCDITLVPGQATKVSTGVHLETPEDYAAFIFPRSGLGSKGLRLMNTVGVIDSDYRGEIFVFIRNEGNETIKIPKYGRFAQLVFMPVLLLDGFSVVPSLSETERGISGHGSTGV